VREQTFARTLSAAALGLCLTAAASSKTHTIVIENMTFNPPAASVAMGDRIVWVNKDLFPHTVTADGKAFDSGSIGPNASWTFVVPKSGSYPYACVFHPTMKGMVVVL
jgi:plastocyanin